MSTLSQPVSKSTPEAMSLFQELRIFFNIFHRIGFSPKIQPIRTVSLARTQKSSFYQKYCSSPFLLFILHLIADISWAWITNLPEARHYNSIGKIMNNLCVVCDIIKVCSIFIPTKCYGRVFMQILTKMQNIQSILAKSLQWNVDYAAFKKSFIKATVYVWATYGLNILLFVLDASTSNVHCSRFLPKIWQFSNTLAFLYIAFYIDLLRFHLLQLNMVIKHDVIIHNDTEYVSDHKKRIKALLVQKKMQIYKIIYFHLWEISLKINKIFGWTIAAVILQTFINATAVSCMMYHSIRTQQTLWKIIRQYF